MKSNELKEFTFYLVEDHPLIRSYLERVLSRHFSGRLVGVSDSAAVARQEIAERNPTLVLADLSLKAGHGLELIKDLQAIKHPAKVLVLSAHDEAAYAERALAAGASGYLGKNAPPLELIEAVGKILSGEVYLSPSMIQRVLNRASSTSDSERNPVDQFSDRELEVFELLGKGCDTRQIAHHLGIDSKTVDTYRSRIKEKLGVTQSSRLHLAAYQWVTGVLEKPELTSAAVQPAE